MARTLASAWVSISPSGFADFGRKAKEGIKTALRGADATVPIKADTKPAGTDLDKLKARLAEFSRTVATARANVDTKQAAADLAKMDVRLDRLSRKVSSPRLTLEGVKAAEAELLGFEATFDRVGKKTSGGGGASLLSGAGKTAGGLAAGAGLLAAGSGALALASPLAAATTAMAAFGAVAIPTLKETFTAAGKNAQAQTTYNDSIGKAKLAYAQQMAVAEKALSQAKTAQQRQAALNQEHAAAAQLAKAEAGAQLTLSQNTTKLTGSQQQLQAQVKDLQKLWGNLQQKMAPVVVSVASLAVQLATNFMPLLGPLVTAGGKVITAFLQPLDTLVKSADFSKIITAFTQFGVQAAKLAGPQLVQLVKVLLQLFVDVMPAGVKILGSLLPALVSMVTEATPVVTLVAQWTAATLDWLNKNKLLVPALWGLVTVVAALKLGLLANPIGLVVVAVALLAEGFTIAWKKSATFRDVIKDIGKVFLEIGIIVVEANKLIVLAFLDMVGAVIDGAAKAFGWVPGLGPKLKGAAKAFDGLKDGVGNAFDGMIGTLKGWQKELDDSKDKSKSTADAILGDFNRQGKAAIGARKDLDAYSTAIAVNGANSDKAKAARNKLVTDMEAAGVNSKTANRDVSAYTNAVSTNGSKSDQAKAARDRLNADIAKAFKNSQQGRTDLNNFTNAVSHHSSTSDAVRGARQRLIADLEKAGVDSNTAKTDVNNLQHAINVMHGKGISITMSGKGYYTISESGQNFQISAGGLFSPHAAGGLIKGGAPGRDSVLGLLMPGEVVVPTAMVKAGAVDHLRGSLPGFAAGGGVGPVSTGGAGIARMYRDDVNDEGWSLVSSMRKTLKKAETVSAGSIGNYKPGAGVAQWAGVILRALAMIGQSSSWLGTVERRMNQESGGNPTIVNRWDSNWLAGHPSVGLMQVIRGTFQTWAGQFRNTGPFEYGVSVNPLANTFAGLNYALHTYGSLAALNRAGGYDHGGYLPTGLSLAYNGTGRPEPVGPTAAGGVQLHLTVNGPVGSQAELENWFVKTANQAARTGRLTQAVKRAGG